MGHMEALTRLHRDYCAVEPYAVIGPEYQEPPCTLRIWVKGAFLGHMGRRRV